ncbi:diaminopimelate epimerase [Streptomyces sp. ISL-43]|uniref:diaminopimelate epimerase n=1 Tax=Streptomyces sp. ISL-43 TaxID=2819183 RepID=UPI001BEC0EFF|nr:diaminopimelate epimerase [Streptomyces sp. ISL-43]MBT2446038.1 diaminopimelate epimerase [Streptomyces sp. ISL-43]
MTAIPISVPFAKGHGSGNDFVVLDDPDGLLDLTTADIVELCDRRRGIGADGVLRLVRCTADVEAFAMAGHAEWFMDYRNADGSLGAMCGNGARVLAQHLVATGRHQGGPLTLATRAGVRHLHVPTGGDAHRGDVSVSMGIPIFPGPARIAVTVGARRWSGAHVDMGNPHAVAFVDNLDHAGTLATAPVVSPASAYPYGVTVEFVRDLGSRHLALRVHERGVGETPSCGTGACAAVAAALPRTPGPRGPVRYAVDAPGGRLMVDVAADGNMTLTGPAYLTAQGTVRLHSAWPNTLAEGEWGLQQPAYGVPTPALLARADRGLNRLIGSDNPDDTETDG